MFADLKMAPVPIGMFQKLLAANGHFSGSRVEEDTAGAEDMENEPASTREEPAPSSELTLPFETGSDGASGAQFCRDTNGTKSAPINDRFFRKRDRLFSARHFIFNFPQ
jgi:hypothetical protein